MYKIPNYFNKSLLILIPLVGLVIVGIFIISYGVTDADKSLKFLVHGIVITSGLWLGCMAIVTFLWRKFPWEQAPFRHLIIEIIFILAYTVAFSSFLYYLERKFWNIHEVEYIGMEVFTTILITLLITSIHESVFFYQQWKYNFSKSVRLEKDNIEARYEALMAQINPHFLFNSLNSLTSMVEDNKPVVDYIQNLSGLLRYMMKSGENELVPLRDELEITNSYISLQMTRFRGSLEIIVNVPDTLLNSVVPPLVLQSLVENCIKHNVISREKPLRVVISADKDSISVTNNLQKKQGVASTGQGLNNIRGRYGFFTSTKVEITEEDGFFKVTLPLLRAEL
ncbi:MAG: histidine kinase [Bacteroidales bacterium]|nr:histidine kinase [Bacteroidales bacterium]